jgi:hypothetical protein
MKPLILSLLIFAPFFVSPIHTTMTRRLDEPRSKQLILTSSSVRQHESELMVLTPAVRITAPKIMEAEALGFIILLLFLQELVIIFGIAAKDKNRSHSQFQSQSHGHISFR